MIDQGFGFDSAVQQTDEDTFVEVCYAKSIEEASVICKLLEGQQIATLVETDPALPDRCGVAVLVRSGRLVEASEVLTLETRDHDACSTAAGEGNPDVLDLDSADPASHEEDDDDDDDDGRAIDLFEDHPDF